MRRSGWWRRAGVVVAAVGLVGVGLPGTAWAGGPTSVLLVSPQTGRTAALYNSDPAYQQLSDLLGQEPQADPAPPPTDGGSTYVTVTWLVHDVDIWRIDRAFLDTSGGPWVVTQTADENTGDVGTDLWPGERGGPGAVWHRPGDPAALLALFADLDLLRTGQSVKQAVTVPPPVAAPPVDDRDSPWWWAGAGALVGIGLGVGGLRGRERLRREREPVAGRG